MANKRLKKVDEKRILTLALIFLAVFALGILFIANPRMTGNVVEQSTYTTQEDCEGVEGNVWYNEVCYDGQPVCSIDFLELCLNQEQCVGINGLWEDVVVGQENCLIDPCDVCESDCVNLCVDGCEDAGDCVADCVFSVNLCVDGCEDAGDCVADCVFVDLCVEGCLDDCTCVEGDVNCVCDDITEKQCVECVPSKTCASDYSGQCGIALNNGCEDILDCSNNCDSGYSCVAEVCTQDVCDVNHLNLCDDTNCADATGYWYNSVCHAGECVPDTCEDLGCGTQNDGCGGTLDCPACSVPTKAPPKEVKSSCVSQWECTIWGECIDGTQTRTCTDIHNCVLKVDEPDLSQVCEVIVEETCFDGIKNQDEEGVDCGGVCEQRCSTLTGSAISPIESGKEFFQKNKTIVLLISGVLVLALAGFLTFGVLKKKKILPKVLQNFPNVFPKIKMLFKKNSERPTE